MGAQRKSWQGSLMPFMLPRDLDVDAHNAKVRAWREQEAKRAAKLRENDQRTKADGDEAPPPDRVHGPGASHAASSPPHAPGTAAIPLANSAPSFRRAAVAGAPSKYRNKPTNGYASKKEAKRAFALKLMEEAGQIRNLLEQVPFLLIPKQDGERACTYVADFVYEEWCLDASTIPARQQWLEVVEDCKGMRTDVYRVKRKLMLMVHGIKIRET